MLFPPEPGLHSAHRGAQHQANVLDAQLLAQQPVLRLHHVVVGVAGKPRAETVARLRRLAVADPVGQHDEIPLGVEQLSGAEEDARECFREELGAAPARAVQDEDRVAAVRLAQRAVMDAQLGKGLARGELEAPQDVIALGNGRRRSGGEQGQQSEQHGRPPRRQASHFRSDSSLPEPRWRSLPRCVDALRWRP